MSETKQNTEQNECRICYETGSRESMVSPCDCSGSMKYVHKQCLLSWINTIHGIKCHICGTEYKCRFTIKRPHFWTFIKRDFHHFWADLLILIHICFVMICSQTLGFYVMKDIFRQKCMSSHYFTQLVDIFCKILVTNVMIISTALNALCFIIFWSEFRQLFVERWNQFLEFSFDE